MESGLTTARRQPADSHNRCESGGQKKSATRKSRRQRLGDLFRQRKSLLRKAEIALSQHVPNKSSAELATLYCGIGNNLLFGILALYSDVITCRNCATQIVDTCHNTLSNPRKPFPAKAPATDTRHCRKQNTLLRKLECHLCNALFTLRLVRKHAWSLYRSR